MLVTVSVVIPTYRRENTLREALYSVCGQTYSFVEMIVVDDNAETEWNKRVEQIVNSISTSLPANYSIQLIQNQTNRGAAESRNIGIGAANGSYITFLDDDDVYLPEKISTQLAMMQGAAADFSLMDLELFNDKGHTVEHKTHPYISGTSDYNELIRLHLMHHLTGTDTMMFRKEYLHQIGCFDPIDIGDEFYLMMKALEAQGKFLYIPQTLVRARVHYDGSGLSGGAHKLQGEKTLFQFKKKSFHYIKRRDRRYICMRHHAVMAFAYLRSKNLILFLLEGIYCLLISPVDCIQMLYRMYHK